MCENVREIGANVLLLLLERGMGAASRTEGAAEWKSKKADGADRVANG